MRFQLKFKDAVSTEMRKSILEELAERGVVRAEAVFPDSTDSYRRSLYIIETGSAGTSGKKLFNFLKSSDAVEIIEPEVRHRLAAGHH